MLRNPPNHPKWCLGLAAGPGARQSPPVREDGQQEAGGAMRVVLGEGVASGRLAAVQQPPSWDLSGES